MNIWISRFERRIRLADPPLPLNHPLMHGIDYVGVQTSHKLTVEWEQRDR